MTVPAIELKQVHKAFGAKEVLKGVSLTVDHGDSCAIIGGSGSGKSVTLKCMLGLTGFDRGSIAVDGQDLGRNGTDAHMSKFGVLFQGGALFDSMTVWRNVAFRQLRGPGRRPEAEGRKLAVEKLEHVGLGPEVVDLYPSELSGGMQRRVGLARAIAADPDYLFFDEPTTGLDPVTASVINNLIRTIVNRSAITAVTISHDLSSIRTIADRVAMIRGGKICWEGDVTDLGRSGNHYVEQFVRGSAHLLDNIAPGQRA